MKDDQVPAPVNPLVVRLSDRAVPSLERVPTSESITGDARRILASLVLSPSKGLPEMTTTALLLPVLVMTVGLPGTGKSTFARRLAREIDAAVLESDTLRSILSPNPTVSTKESRQLFAAIHVAAGELLRRDCSVIIDATSIKEAHRQPIYDVAAATGARLVIVRLTASEATITARLARREREAGPGGEHSVAGLAVYRRMRRQEQPLLREHWQVDTSEPATAEEAFWRVVAACQTSKCREGRSGGSL